MKSFFRLALVASTAIAVAGEDARYSKIIRGLEAHNETHNETMAPSMPAPSSKGKVKGKGGGHMGMMPMGKGKGMAESMEESMEETSAPSMLHKSKKGDDSKKGEKSASSKSDKSSSKKEKSVKSKGSGKGKGKGKGSGKGDSKSKSKKGMKMMGKGKGKGKGKGMGTTTDRPTGPPGMPTPEPTQSPLPDGATRAPTNSPTPPLPFPTISVIYTVFYTINQVRLPLPSEYAAVADLTEAHLNDFFEAAYADDDLVNFLSSETVLLTPGFSFGEPVDITYNTTLTFTQDSFTPRDSEVETLVTQAFSGSALNEYTADVTGLPISNLFSTTSAITLEVGVDARSGSGTASGTGFLSGESGQTLVYGAAAGAGVAFLAIAALVINGRRRETVQSRRKTLFSDGHCTVGGETMESASITERGDTGDLDDVRLD